MGRQKNPIKLLYTVLLSSCVAYTNTSGVINKKGHLPVYCGPFSYTQSKQGNGGREGHVYVEGCVGGGHKPD